MKEYDLNKLNLNTITEEEIAEIIEAHKEMINDLYDYYFDEENFKKKNPKKYNELKNTHSIEPPFTYESTLKT